MYLGSRRSETELEERRGVWKAGEEGRVQEGEVTHPTAVEPTPGAGVSPLNVVNPVFIGKRSIALPLVDSNINVERISIGGPLIISVGFVEGSVGSIPIIDYETHITTLTIPKPTIISPQSASPQPIEAPSINHSTYLKPAQIPPVASIQQPILTLKNSLSDVNVDSRVIEPVLQEVARGGDLLRALGLEVEVHDYDRLLGASSIFNCEGTTVIEYPGRYTDKGLDESIALLAVELERIFCGNSYDPRFVNVNDEDLEFLIRDEGVYVIRGKPEDNKVLERVRLVFNRFIGYGPKIVIISEDLAKDLGYEVVKPSMLIRVSNVDEDALRVFARAYTGFATGKYCDDMPSGLNALAGARLCLGSRMRSSMNWVLHNMPHKLRPSVGGKESESHIGLKAMVIRYLVEVLGLKDFKVEDEISDQDCRGLKPDILADIGGRSVAIDVKAGIGSIPTTDIVDAYNKYSQCGEVLIYGN
ncbi:MAG: hypothetical protein ACP5NQ_08645 [Vulcanisaeta sp.]